MWVLYSECQAWRLIGSLVSGCGAVKCLPITCVSPCSPENHCLTLINVFKTGQKKSTLTRNLTSNLFVCLEVISVSHILLIFPFVCLTSSRFPESGHFLWAFSRNRRLEEKTQEGHWEFFWITSLDYAHTKRATQMLTERNRNGNTSQHNIVLSGFLNATSLLGWFHWPCIDWRTNGAGHGGSEPLLSAGTWKRHDPEGATERWETEETRGEEDTVRTSASVIVIWVCLSLEFLSIFWCTPVSLP